MNARRRLLVASGLLLAGVRCAGAQSVPPRVGVLIPSSEGATSTLVDAFIAGLRQLGYTPGRNLVLHTRYAGGEPQQVPKIARELADAGVAIIVTTTDAVVRTVARQAPHAAIVMVNTSDPVGNGLVASLAQPGGNVTGLTNLSPEIGAKRVEVLKECVPSLSRLAYLWNPRLPASGAAFEEVKQGADRLRLELIELAVQRAQQVERALATLPDRGRTGLLVQAPNPIFYTERARICRAARARRLPSMFNRVEYPRAGGLLSYGPNVPEMYRRAAAYVDRILQGANPATLPVEQPSKFELAVNVETARALGVDVPPALLARADTVIG